MIEKLKKFWWLWTFIIAVSASLVAFGSQFVAIAGAPAKADERWEKTQGQIQTMTKSQQNYFTRQQVYQAGQEQINEENQYWLRLLTEQSMNWGRGYDGQ